VASDDYYAVLGVPPHASTEDIRRAYRELALRWHPDRSGKDTTFIFQKLSMAYEVLADPDARTAYDRARTSVEAVSSSGRRAPGILMSRLSATLPVLIATGAARLAEPGVIELILDADEVVEGGMVRIAMRVEVRDGDRIIEEPFSAWLAVRPGVADGTLLKPSANLPNMVQPIVFRVRTP
jgi:curved DNA-binding protein CbpA